MNTAHLERTCRIHTWKKRANSFSSSQMRFRSARHRANPNAQHASNIHQTYIKHLSNIYQFSISTSPDFDVTDVTIAGSRLSADSMCSIYRAQLHGTAEEPSETNVAIKVGGPWPLGGPLGACLCHVPKNWGKLRKHP